ncbi:MFS transporter [Lacimicrobium alkaliphilum]|jgi:glycoside/pentoside/hexuronide:cation symporter, GPH family|uniref:Sodium:galactoside symporter n=1 Tax=Lacimicrobium alkaliphilum TaxID=1526571 RepID=A0A0U3AFE7_9ALTE|nr:MFS transporter [Lacimicrobium alkaliphilum]ALS99758.1 sodium:galactoside symporter [Lacimicrobium alkaliphilum]
MTSYKLSTFEKVGFGAGDMAVNVVISSMMLIITFFYTDIFGLKPTDMALMFLLVRVMDAVTDPLMGLITDKYKSRWGRYRPYFLFLSVPFGLSVFLTFSTPDADYNLKLAWAYSTYIFVTLMFTAVTIPYISLIGVLTDDPKERLSANGYRLFFAKVAAFLVTIIVPMLASADYWQGDKALGYQVAMGLMSVMAVALFLFCFFATTERLEHQVDKKPLKEQFSLLLKNDQWLVLCGVCVLGTIGYVVRGSVALYYAKYYLGGDGTVQSMFLSTGVGAAILAMVASTWITKKYCKVKLFRFSQMAVGVLSVLMFVLVDPGDLWLAFVMFFLVSFVVDLHAPIFWSAIAEAVDYGQSKTGKRVAGLSFGGISFCQKAGMGLAGGMVGLLLAFFDYVPDQVQSDKSLMGIALMLTIIPGLFHYLVGALMKRYRITDLEYQRLLSELEVSRTVPPAPDDTETVKMVTGV